MRASTLLVVFDSFSQNPANSACSSTRPPDCPTSSTIVQFISFDDAVRRAAQRAHAQPHCAGNS
jgi:hypothetical protein